MSSTSTPLTTTATTTDNNTLDMSSSSDATDQANSYANAPQEQTLRETPAVPESTTTAETTSELPLTTATTDLEATATETTQDQVEPTTQAHKATTEAPKPVEATQITQNAQAYTEAPYNNHDQVDNQPATTQYVQQNPTWTLTETSIASASSPTVVVVTSTSGVSTILPTSTCLSDSSTSTTSNVCISSSEAAAVSQEANAAKMTVAQIAGIVVGVLGVFSLLVACILFKKRKHGSSRANNKRRISPFFYMNDTHNNNKDPEKSLPPFDTSTAALCQSYKNEQPYHTTTITTTHTSGSISDMSESVCGDNIFYSNSTDYHQSSTQVQPLQGINEKLTVITSRDTKSHQAVGYVSSPLKTDVSVIDTPTTLYPHMKRNDGGNDFNKQQTSNYNPFSNRQQQRQQQQQRTSTDIDTDNYTLSAMQLFQSTSNRNTATTTTTSRSMSPTKCSFVAGTVRQQYRPSLHDSMYLGSQISSSSDDTSTVRSLPVAQPPPPRFSRHHRQESSLDPHFYQHQQRQQQQSHTMSLWDDHLN